MVHLRFQLLTVLFHKYWVTDGSGALNWTDLMLIDADADTKIQVEESSDEDIIRFDLGGTEYFTFGNGAD